MKLLRRTLAGALLVGLLYAGWRFATGNSEPVRVDYLLGEMVDVALWRALVVAFAIGVVGALAFSSVGLVRARLERRGYRKALAALEAEVHQLRNLPLVTQDTPAMSPPDTGSSTISKGRSA